MRKILIFMLLAFSVVCYAAPPPLPEPTVNDVQFVVHDYSQYVQQVDLDSYRGQEVAFVYLGKFDLASYAEYMIIERAIN